MVRDSTVRRRSLAVDGQRDGAALAHAARSVAVERARRPAPAPSARRPGACGRRRWRGCRPPASTPAAASRPASANAAADGAPPASARSASARARAARRRRSRRSARPRRGRCASSVSVAATPPSAKSPRRLATSWHARPGAGGPRRQRDLREQLVGRERGGQRGDEEVGGGDGALAARATQREPRVERHHHRRQLGGGVGVREAAAERAARADLRMTDERHAPAAISGQRSRIAAERSSVALPDQGAEPQAAVRRGDDLAERARRRLMSISRPGPREAEVQHRHEALAAGQHAGARRRDGPGGPGPPRPWSGSS